MNIKQLRKNKNQNKIIFLTTNNSTPIRIKRINFSNSQNLNQHNSKYRNKNIFYNSPNKSLNNTQNYIFNCYKISPIIALSIYEKTINKLLEYIKKRLPKKNYYEIKRKYISYVIDELHIKSKNILMNITDQDLLNVNVKLFISNNNNSISNNIGHSKFTHYNKLNINSNILYKTNCNSNSLFKLNKKNKSKREKLLSFKSFNNLEFKKQINNSLVNSSNVLVPPKSIKNICQTEYNQKYNNSNNNTNNITASNQKIKRNKKIEKIKIKEHFSHLRNVSMMNGSPYNIPLKSIFGDKKKNTNDKERKTNKGNKIVKRNKQNNNCCNKTIEENKQIQNEEKLVNNNKNSLDIKDSEKICVHQLNIIKENLEDNLKNMFNFSYGYFLNNERESDSSKSLHDLYKFSNKIY